MYTQYQTGRLILKLLSPAYYKDVLEFQKRNMESFEEFEPAHPANFYTNSYQMSLLKCEYKMAQKLTSVRMYVFLKEDPYTIIGTVCLHNITRAPYECCEIGYKFDLNYRHCGYAREAVDKMLSIAFFELRLHRVFARVSLENTPSIRLLEHLHFVNEGVEHSSILIQNKWKDYLRFGLINYDYTRYSSM